MDIDLTVPTTPPSEESALLHRAIQEARCVIWRATVQEWPRDSQTPTCSPIFNAETNTYLHWSVRIVAPDALLCWLPLHPVPGSDLQEAFYLARPQADRIRTNLTAVEALRSGQSHYHQEFALQTATGETHWLSESVTVERATPDTWHLVGICTDITPRKQIEARLSHEANHDPLTGLANRRQLLDTIQHYATFPRRRLALLFLDLDNFKQINDTLGHLFGDLLLVALADRLQTVIGSMGHLTRLGGDEFTVLLPHVRAAFVPTALAERLLQAISQPFELEGRTLVLSGTIGIAIAECPDATELLRQADTAMYYAKGTGKGRWAVYEERMSQKVVSRFGLEFDLRRAVHAGEIGLHYQPIVSLSSGELLGVEALARWEQAAGHYVSPLHFIPIAEETGLIRTLGQHLLRKACQQGTELHHRFPQQKLRINVNFSQQQFHTPDFVEQVQQALDETGFPPTSLCLELTESALLQNAEEGVTRIRDLQKRGISFSLDDFGTGYSSLAYLSRLPVKGIKIDAHFVQAITSENRETVAQNVAIIRAILGLAYTFDLPVTAEGVEDEEQRRRLINLGVGQGQGFLFARPLPPSALLSYMGTLCPDLPRAA